MLRSSQFGRAKSESKNKEVEEMKGQLNLEILKENWHNFIKTIATLILEYDHWPCNFQSVEVINFGNELSN